MNEFQGIFNNFLSTLLTAVLGLLAAFLIALAKKGFEWLTTKIEAINNKEIRDDLNQALDILNAAVYTTVMSLQQTLGDDIKESLLNNDGKYIKEDLLNLKAKAINSIKSQLNQSVLETISTVYYNIDEFIGDLIETQVRRMKQETALPVIVEDESV